MNFTDKVVVQTRMNARTGALEHSPLSIVLSSSQPYTTAISYAGDDRRWYADYGMAEKVARDYKDGPGDDVRVAHWNNENCEWEIASRRPSSTRGQREDFHADG